MTIKPFLFILPLAALTAACGGDKKNNLEAANATASSAATKIAYVDVDSLQNKYQYYIDAKSQLEAKIKSYQDVIRQKEQALQQMQVSLQQRMQNGSITSEAQYKAEVSKIQRQQEAYAIFTEEALKHKARKKRKTRWRRSLARPCKTASTTSSRNTTRQSTTR